MRWTSAAVACLLAVTACGRATPVLDRETLVNTDDGFVLTFPQGLASLALSDDGATVALAYSTFDPAGARTRLIILDADNATARWSDVYPNSLCCSPPIVRIASDGEHILGVGDGVRVYSGEGQTLFQIDLPGESFGLAAALSNDGRLVAVLTSGDRAHVYSVPDRRIIWSGGLDSGSGLALSGDGRLMLIAENRMAHLYDTSSFDEIASWPLAYSGSLTLAGLSRDGALAVAAGYTEENKMRVTLRDLAAGKQTEVTIPTLHLPELQVSPDGEWIRLVGRFRGGGLLLDRDGGIIHQIAPSESGAGGLLSRNAHRLALSDGPKVEVRFDERSFAQWRTLADTPVQALCLAGDRLAALGSTQPQYPLSDHLQVWSVSNP